MKLSKFIFPAALLVAIFLWPVSSMAQDSDEHEASRAAKQTAEVVRAQAVELREVAEKRREVAVSHRKVAEVQREASVEEQKVQAKELEHARDEMRAAQTELRQAQAEMREASRAVAAAQREMISNHSIALRGVGPTRVFDFQNRAVIGVVMGGVNDENGVTVIGLTPGGPAETAGLEKGDVIIGVNGLIFGDADNGSGTEIIKDEISEMEPGDKVELLYQRDGEDRSMLVTTQVREPLTVYSRMGMPDAPFISEQVLRVIEQVEMPDMPEVDMAILEDKLQIMEQKLLDGDWSFGGPHYNVQFAPGAEFSYEVFSDLASSAIDNTMVWFSGSQYVQGLQFAAMNDDLGVYFDTPEGVLVLQAREDNSLDLRSGDVIIEINGKTVNQPADVMRELRFVEDNSEAEFLVMRNRNLESLLVVLPEREQIHEIHIAPDADE